MQTQRTMREIRHFIWDFDGTLFDTYPIIIGSLRDALRDYGRDCDPLVSMKLMLDAIPTARNYYADLYGIDRDELSNTYRRYYKPAIDALTAKPFPGIAEVLERICSSGRYNYIYTHRDIEETVRFLEKHGLLDYFTEIVGSGSPAFAVKPAPDTVLYLMDKYGMSAADTVMVGDRECDLGSGRSAGIGAVHYVCAEVPEDLVCDWRVDTFSEMLALL